MPSALSEALSSLVCFRRKPRLTIGTPVSYDLESKQPRVSSRSIESDLVVDDQTSPSTEKHDKLFITEKTVLQSQSQSHAPLQKTSEVSVSIQPQLPSDQFLHPQSQQQEQERRTNRALAVVEKGRYEILESYPFPTLRHEGEVVIRTHAVGLNPIDWKSVDYGFCLPEFPWITGREMAGVVEQVGSDVTDFHVGQRVWTSTYYRDCRAGCFQEFVTVPQHTVSPVPQGMTFEEASCLGVAGLTAAMTLWRWLEVEIPGSSRTAALSTPGSGSRSDSGYLLIWGGSTITAQFAIQLAVLGGLSVIAVTSAKTKPLALTLGATHVVTRDGKTGSEIVSEILSLCGDAGITRAIDLVGTETAAYCLEAFSRSSRRVLFAPLAMMSSKTVVPANVAVQTVEMKQFVLDPASRVYSRALNALVKEGSLVLPQIEVLEGGLDVVQRGLDRVKRGDMAGRKVVVRM